METKRCCHCHIEKPLNEFNRQSNTRDGLRPDCKSCIAARAKAKWPQVREAKIAQMRVRYYASDAHVHRLPEIERFWAHVEKSEETDGCWLWMGSRNPSGYGTFHRKPYVSAHRFA